MFTTSLHSGFFFDDSGAVSEEIGEMISAADLDKDGFINEEEFLRILKKGVAGA